jgi:hypothetical protein
MSKSAAQRQAEFRQRERDGRRLLPAVEVELYRLVEAMIDAGLVDEDKSDDLRLIGSIAGRMLDAWARNSVARYASLAAKQGKR